LAKKKNSIAVPNGKTIKHKRNESGSEQLRATKHNMLAFMSDCGGSDGSDGSVEVAQWFQDLARSKTGAAWQVVVSGETKGRTERRGDSQTMWRVDVQIARDTEDNAGVNSVSSSAAAMAPFPPSIPVNSQWPTVAPIQIPQHALLWVDVGTAHVNDVSAHEGDAVGAGSSEARVPALYIPMIVEPCWSDTNLVDIFATLALGHSLRATQSIFS